MRFMNNATEEQLFDLLLLATPAQLDELIAVLEDDEEPMPLYDHWHIVDFDTPHYGNNPSVRGLDVILYSDETVNGCDLAASEKAILKAQASDPRAGEQG